MMRILSSLTAVFGTFTCLLTVSFAQQHYTLMQNDIASALQRDRVLVPGRVMMSARLVCTLEIDHVRFPAIELVEKIINGVETRKYSRVIILNQNLTKANELPFNPPAEPQACKRDVLVFSGPVEVDNTLPEGTAVRFSNGAADAEVLPGLGD